MKSTSVEDGEEALVAIVLSPKCGRPVCIGLDGHAHADRVDGFSLIETDPAKAGIIHGHNHDAHIGGPPRGWSSMPGAGK